MLRVLYLIFNEGYAATEGDELIRGEPCTEAIRLGRLLTRLMPDEAEVWGLLALMLLHDSRGRARVRDGRYVALHEQDRSQWDRAEIEEGLGALGRAVRLRRPGEHQLQAAITALHMEADGTDWAQIAELYGALAQLRVPGGRGEPGSGCRLCRGTGRGPAAARALVSRPEAQALPAAARRARRAPAPCARTAAAKTAYHRAIALTANAVERAVLEYRLLTLRGG